MKLNKYWFGPRRFGFGISPASWEGWAVLAAYVVLLVALNAVVAGRAEHIAVWVVLTAGLIVIASMKYGR